MKHEPLGTDQQGINVDAVSLGIEWSFVQNEHDMKHPSVANEVEVGSNKWPELEALRCLVVHLGGVTNQGQSKEYVCNHDHHDAHHLTNLHVLHVA